jgi:hypothetical protein
MKECFNKKTKGLQDAARELRELSDRLLYPEKGHDGIPGRHGPVTEMITGPKDAPQRGKSPVSWKKSGN